MPESQSLKTRIGELKERISEACASADRDFESVTLLAVSKTRPGGDIEIALGAGITRFGENYVDEAAAKQDQLGRSGLEWHFIGPIQSNKTRTIAERFDWVHSADRAKVIRRLGEQRSHNQSPLNVLLQVNIDREPQKAGCDPDDLETLAALVAEFPALRLRGLMAIPSADNSSEATRAAFAAMRRLYQTLKSDQPGVDTLSMGMSGDLEAAIAEGSTMVRVGTALFGPRANAG